ncbi:ferritin-like domain-containing protein [Aldersonia sp. NBC_00410]|uniref:ferritin-like domain-containing protein n=1 Tax=Aldersonia sp. NBC_00410 TaxID=2975954 RepID=UPI0022502DBC|nr:ferritin-like domain-containing protein [Aldersonia sp. NBC_00410]MCX5046548.1 ferritin-like domain-containing protein [Aldersonia sp. NBC_00410]
MLPRKQDSIGPEQQALIDALRAEHAAIFAYGLVAAFSNPQRADLIATNSAAHRARRDATIDALTAASIDPPVADSGYTVPFPVVDPITAAQLAATVESDTAVAWRSVVERAAAEHTRRTGVDALTECAVRLATWRTILGTAPVTVPFPGQP